MYLNWSKYGIEVPSSRHSGNYKTTCPNCRDSRGNPRDKSLSCNLADGTFLCHHCDWSGCVAEEEDWEKQQRKEQQRKTYFNAKPLKRQKKSYPKPKLRPENPYSQKLVDYITNDRHLSVDTLKALHVTEGPELMPQDGKVYNCIQFNYFKDGVLVNTKFRSGNKYFKLVTGAERLPYNIDSIKGQEFCIITEGEFDALSFYEVGFHNVVSVPTGANNNLSWLDDYIEEYFDDKKTIYIASDADPKGTILRDELLRRFGPERCRVVEYGDGCKDANEHLAKFGKKSLCECISNAKEVPLEGVFTVSDFEDRLDALYQSGLQPGATIGLDGFDQLCSFVTKTLCVITGIPNYGKSEFLDEILYRLNLRYGWRFAFFSPENDPLEFHASKLIEKFVGKKFGRLTLPINEYDYAKQHLDQNFFFIEPKDDFLIDTIFADARALVRRNGIKGLVIDPYNYLEDDHGNSETDYVSKLLSKMKTFAKLNDIIIFLVAHPTKLQKNKDGTYDAPDLYNISGSAHFNNKADIGICVHRIFGLDEYVQLHCLKMRFKHLGHKGVANAKYNLNNGRYVPYTPGSNADIPWDNANHLFLRIDEAQRQAAANAILPFGEDNPDPFDNNDDPLSNGNEDCPY